MLHHKWRPVPQLVADDEQQEENKFRSQVWKHCVQVMQFDFFPPQSRSQPPHQFVTQLVADDDRLACESPQYYVAATHPREMQPQKVLGPSCRIDRDLVE